jgi:hypothetical protein
VSAAGLTDDELDRLADYTADALGPAEAAQVAHLVATDPRWSQAHAQLLTADAWVRAELAHAGRIAPTMPEHVVVRLSETVHDLARTRNVVSLAKARERRHRRRLSLSVAAAAAGVVTVLGGLAIMGGQTSTSSGSSAAAPQADTERNNARGALPSPPPAFAANTPVLLSSGTNYTAASLGQLAARPLPSGAVAAPQAPLTKSDTAGGGAQELSAPEPLQRLVGRPALGTCLAAIQILHPGMITTVDYARFNGSPALIVVTRQVNGSMVVVVGPNCGLTGADELAAVAAP